MERPRKTRHGEGTTAKEGVGSWVGAAACTAEQQNWETPCDLPQAICNAVVEAGHAESDRNRSTNTSSENPVTWGRRPSAGGASPAWDASFFG